MTGAEVIPGRREPRPRPVPRYPEIQVQLSGADGNVFAILGATTCALRGAGVPPEEVTAFVEEATSGDYDHALQTCMAWVEVS